MTEFNVVLDLSDFDSVRQAVHDLKLKAQQRKPVHLFDRLILNAGVLCIKPEKTKQGFEMNFGVNHLGHFLFANLLIRENLLAKGARVIVLSSSAAHAGKMQWDDLNCTKNIGYAYPQSKLANALFAFELNRRMHDEGQSITAYSVDPGFVRSEIFRSALTPFWKTLTKPVFSLFAKTPDRGCEGPVCLASEPGIEQFAGRHFKGTRVVDAGKYPHMSNVDDAKRLWKLSEELVGLESA